MKVLQDKSKKMGVLFNCFPSLDGTRLFCGAIVFKGGLSGELTVINEENKNNKFRIKVPDYVLANNTYIAKTSRDDSLEIEIMGDKNNG